MKSHRGRVAIVTGGASGIGFALGRELGRRGARVVLADIDETRLNEAARRLEGDGEFDTRVVDVTEQKDVKALVEGARDRFGQLDCMFNNAGIAIFGEAHEVSVSDYDRTIDVNVRGVIYGSLAAYDVMRERGRGHIINTASIAGIAPSPGLAAYCASKHAVVGFSKSLRLEAELHGVRVSAVCPGIIDTPMAREPTLARPEDRGRLLAELESSPLKPYPPERCAVDVLAGVERNDEIIVVTGHGKAIVGAQRWAPWLFLRFVRRQMKKSRAGLARGPGVRE